MVIEGGCLKFGVLFWFSIIFSVLGLFILGLGAIVQVVYFNDPQFLEYNILSTPALLIFIGAIIFLIAFVGCCGAMKESHGMIMTFSVLLLGLFILELSAGIASYVKRGELENILEDRLNFTMQQYSNNTEIKKSWDILQHEFECCGINSPDDWLAVNNQTYPLSCCGPLPVVDVLKCENPFKDGCMIKLGDSLKKKSLILALSATGVAIIQILMIAFTCSLARAIRKDYQTV